jgi:extracellular matrix regulatory protein A
MKAPLLNVGFGNVVVADRIVAIVSPGSAPIKRLKEDAKEQGRLIDATYGRKTRAIVVTDSNHVILSAINPETAALRLQGKKAGHDPVEEPEHEDFDETTEADA